MAHTISPNPFNITSELGTTQDVTVSNITYFQEDNAAIILYVKVNGTTVLTRNEVPTGATHTFSNLNLYSVRNAIYDAAAGHSLADCVTLEVINRQLVPLVSVTVSTNAGDLTIAGRLSAGTSWVTSPTQAAPWNMDANTFKLITAWTRPHSAFYGRLKVSIWDGDSYELVYNHYGWPTGSNTSFSTAEYNLAVSKMNGVSPRKVKVELIHQFLTGTNATDIVGATSIVKEIIDGAVKTFYDGSKVGIHDGSNWIDHETYIYNGTAWVLQQVYVYNGTAWVESL